MDTMRNVVGELEASESKDYNNARYKMVFTSGTETVR